MRDCIAKVPDQSASPVKEIRELHVGATLGENRAEHMCAGAITRSYGVVHGVLQNMGPVSMDGLSSGVQTGLSLWRRKHTLQQKSHSVLLRYLKPYQLCRMLFLSQHDHPVLVLIRVACF